ncbi:MAG TPA: hypothetical protein VGM75_18170 [Pseudonocardiaceae bacterium]
MAAVASSDGNSSAGLLGQTILNELTPPADVHTDDTGQNRLKKVQPVIDALQSLAPLYDKWKTCAVSKNMTASAGCWNDQDSYLHQGSGVESKQLPPLATINFGAIYSPYSRMNQMHSAGQALQTIASSAASDLPHYWTGQSADAATTKLGDLQYGSQEYVQTLESLSPHVQGLYTTLTNAVQKLADFADTADGKAIIQAQKDNTGKGQDLGHDMTADAVNSYIDQLNLAVQFGLYYGWNPEPASDSGSSDATVSAAQLRNPGICELDGGHGSWWSDQASSWLDKFGDIYHSAIAAFRTQITASYNAVDQGLGDFTSQISSIPTDPFGKLQAPGTPPPPAQTSNGNTNGNSNTGGSKTGGTGPSSSGGTSASSYTPPPTSPSPTGKGPGAPTIPVQSTPPGGNTPTPIPPITPGNPVGSPPGTPVGNPVGTPVGAPVGTTTTQSTPESMTVQSGNNQISMTSPDSQGNVKLSVNNGSGTQSYNIGFGQGTGTPVGGYAIPAGAAGGPGAIPPGAPGAIPAGGPGAIPAGGVGPSGAIGTPGQIAGQGAQQITPGANGTAVIHDGNLTITATEPHGPHGPVQVTVDDGSGHPSTYTLNPGSSAAGGPPMQPLTGTSPSGTPDPGGYGTPGGQPYSGTPMQGQPGSAYPGAAGTPYDPSAAAAASHQQPAPGGTQSASWLPPATDPSQHLAQHVGGGVGGGGGGGGGAAAMHSHASLGGAVGGAVGAAGDHTSGLASAPGEVSGVGLANTNVTSPGAPGGAGMAGAPGAAGGQPASGGMPMMGGMGGMGGSQGGGDQERGASQWRVRGDLFGDANGQLDVPRVIGEDEQ